MAKVRLAPHHPVVRAALLAASKVAVCFGRNALACRLVSKAYRHNFVHFTDYVPVTDVEAG